MGIFSFGKKPKHGDRRRTPTAIGAKKKEGILQQRQQGQKTNVGQESSRTTTSTSSADVERFFQRASTAGWMLDGLETLSAPSAGTASQAFLSGASAGLDADSAIFSATTTTTTDHLSAQFTNKVQELRNQKNSNHLKTKMNQLKVGQLLFFPNASLVGRDDEVEELKAIVNEHISEQKQHQKQHVAAAVNDKKTTTKTTTTTTTHQQQTLATTTTSRLIWINGTPGTGKTVLAQQLERHIREKTAGGSHNYFLLGKFDQQYDDQHSLNEDVQHDNGGGEAVLTTTAQPYTAFARASHQLADQILLFNNNNNNDGEHNKKEYSSVLKLKQNIERAVGDQGVQLLLEIFPGLSSVIETSCPTINEEHSSGDQNIEGKTNQLEFTARQLFRVLSTTQHNNKGSSSTAAPPPVVVLVLDDVQWADQQSLNLIEALMTDQDSSFILIATSRSNEITKHQGDHPFLKTMTALRKAEIPIKKIELGDLTETAVRSVVANSLNNKDDDIAANNQMDVLANVIYKKTNGNAFFVVQFLNMLVQEDLLTYNIGLMKWVWDNQAIQNLTVADNVGSLLARKIQSLPIKLQTLLKIASCLGQVFEQETFSVAVRSLVEMDAILSVEDAAAVTDSVPACVKLGLIEILGTKYRFPHDLIQASSFQLITQDELPRLQLTIGRGLANHITTTTTAANTTTCGDKDNKDKTKDDLLYLSTDLCNRGRSLITDDTGRISLAFQNLRAAEKAIHKSSAFVAAIAYIKSGLLCLDEPQPLTTEEEYLVKCLRLKLHTAWAEASYCIGDHRTTAIYSTKVIESDFFPFADRFVGYSIRMMTQFATAQVDASMEASLFILKKLKCIKNLPTYPGTIRILMEITKTKNLMKSYTKEDLLNLPLMTDPNRLRAMNVVINTSTITHAENPNLYLVLFLTAMRWTVKYGVCKYSPPVFAIYGMVLCGVLEDFTTGMMIGEVALALSEKLQATQTVSMTTLVVYAFIDHCQNDLRSARKPLEYGYLTGLQLGDISSAFINLIVHDQNSWLVGYPGLVELERTIRKNMATIRSHGHKYIAADHCPCWQTVMNLIGRSGEDPLIFRGEAITPEIEALAPNHKMILVGTACFTGYLGYVYENYEYSIANFKRFKKEDCLGYFTLPRFFGTQALAYIALAQQQKQGKRVRHNLAKARGVMKMLRKWLAGGNAFLNHFICLMEAEIAAILKPHSAATMYETAIKMAARAGFRNDTALAHHRAARFYFVVMEDEYWGSFHIDRSIDLYCEWGAFGVARHLATKYVVTSRGGGKSGIFSEAITMSNHTKEFVSRASIRSITAVD